MHHTAGIFTLSTRIELLSSSTNEGEGSLEQSLQQLQQGFEQEALGPSNEPYVSQYIGHYRIFSGGWVECFTDEGDVYYYNEMTGSSEWELPAGCQEVFARSHELDGQQQQEETDYSSAEPWESSIEQETGDELHDNDHDASATTMNMDLMVMAMGSGGESTADEGSVRDCGEKGVNEVNNIEDTVSDMESPTMGMFVLSPPAVPVPQVHSMVLGISEGGAVLGKKKVQFKDSVNGYSANEIAEIPVHTSEDNVTSVPDAFPLAEEAVVSDDAVDELGENGYAKEVNDNQMGTSGALINSIEGKDDAQISTMNVDDMVEARYHGNEEWCPGHILAQHPDGSYDIVYESGEHERNVAAELVRDMAKGLESPENTKASAMVSVDEEIEAQVLEKATSAKLLGDIEDLYATAIAADQPLTDK